MRILPAAYRAQRINSDEWVVGFLSVDYYKQYSIEIFRRKISRVVFSIYAKVKTETISEYTGKRDRNFNKIFENQICRFYGDEGEFADCVIRWDEKKVPFCRLLPDKKH